MNIKIGTTYYDLRMFPVCPRCNMPPVLNTNDEAGNTFAELVCMCEGEPCPIDLLAIWKTHLTNLDPPDRHEMPMGRSRGPLGPIYDPPRNG